MVFSKTSLQSILISPSNPRAILFSDSVAIAFVRGSPTLEVAAQDPQYGTIFYTIDQSQQSRPKLARERVCLGCHNIASVAGVTVAGMIVRTVFPRDTGAIVNGLIGDEVDHRTPFLERWGGWYVTGKQGPLRHRANAALVNVEDNDSTAPATRIAEPLREKFSAAGYPSAYSDVVALAVLDHQVHAMNLIARVGWDTRAALPDETLRADAEEFVDYLLFVDETKWTGRLEGTSGFSEKFARRSV
jgi:hypothetical protein